MLLDVPVWLWLATIGGLLLLLAVDLVIVDHHPHQVRIAEAAKWVVFYVACAIAFGVMIGLVFGGKHAGEFFAGYITEYSLSVDNLFIFVLIMSLFSVPKVNQHKVLLIGILLALVMRGLFIGVGAAVIAKFSAVFYLFGAFLIYTAYKLARSSGHDENEGDNAALRFVSRISKKLPVTDDYDGARTFVKRGGRRMVTPMLIVMVAIGLTDLLFALDSIPAIFGLTKEPFLVFSANAFALMGLRQLYFLLGGLLERLVYLSAGLSVILAFIGVKLVLEALHENALPFLNDGKPVPVWTPSIAFSLSVIVVVLVLTTIASLIKSRSNDRRAAAQATAQEQTAPEKTAPEKAAPGNTDVRAEPVADEPGHAARPRGRRTGDDRRRTGLWAE